jgi:alcohol dehydrogenase class IV
MVSEAGFSTKLSDLGLKKEQDIKVLVDSVNMERLNNHPVRINEKNLKKILYSAW